MRRLDELTDDEQSWMASHTKPQLSRTAMRQALLEGRLDAEGFLTNSLAVGDLAAADRRVSEALARMTVQVVRRTAQWPTPALTVVTADQGGEGAP